MGRGRNGHYREMIGEELSVP